MNPYEVLGVPVDAPADEVRRAYLRLARRYHPDYFSAASPHERAEAEARMRTVNEAWALVGDAARRREHDAARHLEDDAGAVQGFRPFTPVDDQPDPRDAPDIPYRPPPPVTVGRRMATMAPVLLFAASVLVGGLGIVLDVIGVLAVAFVLFLLSCVGFLVVPLLALSRARQDEG